MESTTMDAEQLATLERARLEEIAQLLRWAVRNALSVFEIEP